MQRCCVCCYVLLSSLALHLNCSQYSIPQAINNLFQSHSMNNYRLLYHATLSLENQQSVETSEVCNLSSSSVCSRLSTAGKAAGKHPQRKATNNSSAASIATHRSTKTNGTRGTKSSYTASVVTHHSTKTTRTNDTDMHKHVRKTLRSIAQNDINTTEVTLNGASFQQQETMVVLAMSLANNTHIRILHLHDCQINDLGANLLAFSLRRNTSIEQLWLNGNNIGDIGAEAIANALHANRTLKTIGLRNNVIGDHGGKRIRDSLKQNRVITDVFLRGNQISDKTTCDIYCYCERNSHEKLVKKRNTSSLISRSSTRAGGKKVQTNKLLSIQEQLPSVQWSGMRRTVARKRNSIVAPCA